ncbi:hypothetical protein NE236_30990 [Actinoallomurus purpureus]|uniref:hypothetical protein n=1 Tax=Actinoallomurus purpureus TaxID=478114 RepID=UPI002093D611|nr:hypothetical protein [Actinoallomurus purpureus]MCO6009406.1 hypothetical protein [Actinoallomurus purpureus]
MFVSPYDMHVRAENNVIAMMASAMRATSTAGHAEDFLRQARTFVLAEGVALTGVLNIHRHIARAPGTAGCATCGTAGACRTLRQINDALAAYLTDQPPSVDSAEAWRRADAWFNANAGQRSPLVVEESADTYLVWPVPRTAGPDDRGLLVIDKRSGRLITPPGGGR